MGGQAFLGWVTQNDTKSAMIDVAHERETSSTAAVLTVPFLSRTCLYVLPTITMVQGSIQH